jgi:hypothetical protein
MPSPSSKAPKRSFGGLRLLLGLMGAILIALSSRLANSAPLQLASPGNLLALENSEPLTRLTNLGSDLGEFFERPNVSPQAQDISTPNETKRASTGFGLSTSNDIRLSGYQHSVFASPPGSTITLNLQNFLLSGHSTLSLLGDATATFIINVTNQFSLAQSSRIVLSGGIQWNHVFFNVLGTGSTVSLSGRSGLVGTLTASQQIVRMGGHAIVYGQVFANRLIIRQAARVINPPPVSQ